MTKQPGQIEDAMDDIDGGVYLRVAYDQEFLAEFKETIPHKHRTWDEYDREWWISERYAKRAIRVASGYFNLEYCD